tara:strand:+ start:2813 stop:3082 length:270 start_codon:yes stop_codon:yes gene_type:complete
MNKFIERIHPIPGTIAGRISGRYSNSQLQTMFLITIIKSNGWDWGEQGSVILVKSEDCIFVEEHGSHEDEIGEFVFVPANKILGVSRKL